MSSIFSSSIDDLLSHLQELVDFAKNNGASQADAYCSNSKEFSYGQRMGKAENIERAESINFSMRLYKDKKKQSFQTSSLDINEIKAMITASMVTIGDLPDDPYCGLPTTDQIIKGNQLPSLSLADQADPSEETLINVLQRAEKEALSFDKINNSKGGTIGWSRTQNALVASNGFAGTYEKTTGSFYVQPVAGSGDQMQVDHDSSTALFFNDLKDPALLGKKAAEKTIAKLNPRKVKTGKYPVVFSQDVSPSIMNCLLTAINGSNIARGVSFLKDKKGKQLFSKNIQIIDDPLMVKGLGSKPFDREALPLSKISLIENGILNHWMMDLVSARKLGCLKNIDQPLRGVGGKTNLYMANGNLSVEDLIKDIKNGFYMTGLMSYPDALVNGDYNVGCNGFWIENGQVTQAVHEVTVSGNLLDMFQNLTPANNLSFERLINTPTLRIEGLSVGGE